MLMGRFDIQLFGNRQIIGLDVDRNKLVPMITKSNLRPFLTKCSFSQYSHVCSATLLTPKHGISAALCFVDRGPATYYFALAGYPQLSDYVDADTFLRMVRFIFFLQNYAIKHTVITMKGNYLPKSGCQIVAFVCNSVG